MGPTADNHLWRQLDSIYYSLSLKIFHQLRLRSNTWMILSMPVKVLNPMFGHHSKTVCLDFFPLFWFKILIYLTSYMNGRATTRVFSKHMCFFFVTNCRFLWLVGSNKGSRGMGGPQSWLPLGIDLFSSLPSPYKWGPFSNFLPCLNAVFVSCGPDDFVK